MILLPELAQEEHAQGPAHHDIDPSNGVAAQQLGIADVGGPLAQDVHLYDGDGIVEDVDDAGEHDAVGAHIHHAQHQTHDGGKGNLGRIEVRDAEAQGREDDGHPAVLAVADELADDGLTEDYLLHNGPDEDDGQYAPEASAQSQELHLHHVGQVYLLAQQVRTDDAEQCSDDGEGSMLPLHVLRVEVFGLKHSHAADDNHRQQPTHDGAQCNQGGGERILVEYPVDNCNYPPRQQLHEQEHNDGENGFRVSLHHFLFFLLVLISCKDRKKSGKEQGGGE